jgi:hypothetical protein
MSTQFNQYWHQQFVLLLSKLFRWSPTAAAAWVNELEQQLLREPRGQGVFHVYVHRDPGWVIIQRLIMPELNKHIRPGEGLSVIQELGRVLAVALLKLVENEDADVSGERAKMETVLRSFNVDVQALHL